MKILLVDDEDSFRESLKKQLAIRGYDVTAVSTGEQALESLERQAVDVVLLDMRMPGMDGVMTLGAIKRQSPTTEVIIVTGHATVKTAMDVMEKGAFDYITKPMRLEELIYKIQDAVRKKELKEQGNNGR
ncbi:MAG: response regulator [Pseudomonadota bacterium]